MVIKIEEFDRSRTTSYQYAVVSRL